MGVWSQDNHKAFEYNKFVESKFYEENFDAFTHTEPKKVRVIAQLNRLVPSQPIQHDTYHAALKARFNLRKLNMLPYHLIEAGLIKSNLEINYFIKFFKNLF